MLVHTLEATISSFTISGGNSAPVLTGDLAADINEGGTYDLTTSDLFYTDSDDDNAGVTFTVSSLDSALTLTVNGASQNTFTGTQLNAGQVRFTHSGVEDDSATFDVNVEDGNEDSSTPTDSTFTFTIVDQNDAPAAKGVSGGRRADPKQLIANITEGDTYDSPLSIYSTPTQRR